MNMNRLGLMLGNIKRPNSLIHDMKIYFKYKARRGGPFFSKVYVATIITPDGKKLEEVTYLDYISPLGEVLADFEIQNEYEYTFQERNLARQAVLEGRNFVLRLVLKRL